MLPSCRKHFVNLKQKIWRRSVVVTPTLEVAIIQVQPRPISNLINSESADDVEMNEANNGDGTVDSNHWLQGTSDGFFSVYQRIAYNLGISLNIPDGLETREKEQQIVFWTIASLSVVQALQFLKFFLLQPHSKRNFLRIGYCLNVLLVKMCWIYLSIKQCCNIKELLLELRIGKNYFPKSYDKKKVYTSVGLILVASVVYCCLSLIQSNIKWSSWTLELVIEYRAYCAGEMVIKWTKNDTTEIERSLDSFTDDINWISASLAIISFAIDAAGLIQDRCKTAILGGFLVYECTHFDADDGYIFYLIITMVKISVFYTSLSQASAANAKFMAWILEKYENKTMMHIENGRSMTMNAFNKGMELRPIGIKIGSILVNPVFISQVVASVPACFFLLVDERT